MGVPERNIWLSEECTFCRPDLYYSYRFARGTTGRQGAFIGKIDNPVAIHESHGKISIGSNLTTWRLLC